MTLMGLLVFALVIWLLLYLVGQLGDSKMANVARVIIIVIAIIWLLQGLGIMSEPLLRVK